MGASVRVDTVDWPKVIREIRGAGLMVKAIAVKAGVCPTTLNSLSTGQTREPRYSVGARLLEIRDRVAR